MIVTLTRSHLFGMSRDHSLYFRGDDADHASICERLEDDDAWTLETVYVLETGTLPNRLLTGGRVYRHGSKQASWKRCGQRRMHSCVQL